MIAYITELNEQNYKSFTESGLVLVDIKIISVTLYKHMSPWMKEVFESDLAKIEN